MDNYKLPLDFVRIFESKIRNLSTQTEMESIDQHLELLITTCPGEHKYDPNYGCKIWDLDFQRVISMGQWENLFTKYIGESIDQYEPRISIDDIKVEFSDTRRMYAFPEATSIKKRVDIKIDAIVKTTGKKCCFVYSLYLGPLSSD